MNVAVLVCHIWQNFYPIEFGGVERYILGLSDFLSQKDQRMRFLMITDKSANVPFLQALQISSYQKINSLEVHRLGPNLSSLLRNMRYRLLQRPSKHLDTLLTANLYREAVRAKGINKVDIFHLAGFWQPLYPTIGLLLSQRFHRPFVVTLHGDSVIPNDPYSMPIRAPATLEILKCADAITTYSRETLNLLQELGLNKRSILVPNFIDTRLFKRPVSSGNGSGTRLVMVSRLSKPKDPMTPIRAFAKVRKEVPKATFKIVGYGPLYDYAHQLVQDLNLEGAVTMVGMQSDVRPFLWDSDISIGTRGSYITTLESWAAGIPVIAPEFGIMKEIISNGENGLLVPPGNIDGLASAMLSLIKNKELRTTIAANGAQAVKKHDIANVSSSISNIYTSLR